MNWIFSSNLTILEFDEWFFKVGQWYDLVIFTASMEIYGAAVSDKLDKGRGMLRRRYFRQVWIKLGYFEKFTQFSNEIFKKFSAL